MLGMAGCAHSFRKLMPSASASHMADAIAGEYALGLPVLRTAKVVADLCFSSNLLALGLIASGGLVMFCTCGSGLLCRPVGTAKC